MNRLEDWVLRTLGALLGLVAIGCGGKHHQGSEYGAPYATYHLGGTVTDANTGTPIPGIRITFWNSPEATAYSGQDGTFTLDATTGYCTSCPAKAADVDGTLNGSYQDKEVPLNLVRTGPGDGHWFQGTFEQKGLAIKLDTKP